ncbi:MAG: sigma 54-interacting transcriptional regulator, partial [Pseudomonadales bacterium]|nr:sigma 54-interacting transcriptional regulator [Pseudomonadales bacterium]
MQISTVLLIEANLNDGEKLIKLLVTEAYSIHWAVNEHDANSLLKTYHIDAVIIGSLKDEAQSVWLADSISRKFTDVAVLLAAACNDEVDKLNTPYACVNKPYDTDCIASLKTCNNAPSEKKADDGVIAIAKASRDLKKMAQRVASCDVSVILMGASGVGKEEFAQYIHEPSRRA